ncbi:TAT-binding protein-like protein 7, AAA ATPase [Lecanora helva]
MPARNKRKIIEFDPNKSDSEDETYGTSASKTQKSRPSRMQGATVRKKQRRRHVSDESDEDVIEESDLSAVVTEDDIEDDEEVELGPQGRPRRKATKKQPKYEESDSDDFLAAAAGNETPNSRPERPSLVVTLKTPRAAQPRRSTRARSASVGISRPTSSHIMSSSTRRSSRIAHDDSEPVIALTDSGHNVDILRPGTRSPPEMLRPTKGGKGIKKPPTSSIYEDSQESPVRTDRHHSDTGGLPGGDDPLEIAASMEDLGDKEDEAELQQARTDPEAGDQEHAFSGEEAASDDVAVIPESGAEDYLDDNDDDDDPISKPGRSLRKRGGSSPGPSAERPSKRRDSRPIRHTLRSTLGKRKTRSSQRSTHRESSDFEPGPEEGAEEDVSDSSASTKSPRKVVEDIDDEDTSPGRRGHKRRKVNPRSQRLSDDHDSEVAEELAEELDELKGNRSRRAARAGIIYDDRKTRQRKPVDYRIMRPDLTLAVEDEGEPSITTPVRKGRNGGGGAWQRTLFSTYGPFGGAGGPAPVLGGPGGIGAAGGADSDSSDDETSQRPRPGTIGGPVGMTPTTTHPSALSLYPAPPGQLHGADALQGPSGTPANVGKIKDKSALADADPLGVDRNVNFDSVGGLQGHINQLKEMVALPLLYPEVFQRFRVTPPRGVLFHGPPGTGKTLLARALASSVSSQGRKVTFYMRKGADALSKWVGEAERQLRLLFDEARKTQPSIIFFDEIDGLAPVRSSKQEQIHASIVSTLLALMDGMDGRGQVIVIGATNRPDSIDPALRRPGRFDREFYFPLPNTEARRTILDIHTKGWDPPLSPSFKDEIAHLTKGYGGADLRALCTEAALNAVQRRYPQIYKSNEKLQIQPETISVTAKDFMISVKKMVPSSERSTTSGAAPLPPEIEPLLRRQVQRIKDLISEVIPQPKRMTALEEAEFEDAEDDRGMKVERMQQEFERSRVFRPRLLVRGLPGMGQQYLAGALLNHFEGLHVQAFDLPTLMSDSTRSPEAIVVQLFAEVRRHKPSIIYIPNFDVWCKTVYPAVISTLVSLLRTLTPTDPVLVLGIAECGDDDIDPQVIKDLFGHAQKNQTQIPRPDRQARHEYFNSLVDYVNTSPAEFPEPADRRKRQFEILIPVPPDSPKAPPPLTKLELKAQKRKDRLHLNMLKQYIQPIMDQMKLKNKKFRTGVIDDAQIGYLYEEDDPTMVSTDLPREQRHLDPSRPYEKATDDHGEPGLIHVATGKFYYNLEIVTIERRLSNGYYKRPKDFTADIKKLAKDARTIGDQERIIKANELLTNVEVDMENIGVQVPQLVAELENVYARESRREKELVEKAKERAAAEGRHLDTLPSNVPPPDMGASSADQSIGPIVLGQPIANGVAHHPVTPSDPSQPSTLTNGYTGEISDLSDLHGHHDSNGTSVPSRGEADLHLSNSDEIQSNGRETESSSFGPSAQTRPLGSYTGGATSLEHRRSIPGSLSQKSVITPMAEGSNLRDYTNYASTTSSEKRNTGSSGDKNTQSTTGKPDGPDFSMFGEPVEGNSQLPDTRGNTQGSQNSNHANSNPSSSQGQGSQPEQLSQTPAVPPWPRDRSSINSLLNDPAPDSYRALTTTQPRLVVDHAYTSNLHEALAGDTTGCSVEQLEQIYSTLMNEIWKTRDQWDRGKVARKVDYLLREELRDIRSSQGIATGSIEIVD